MRLPAAEKLKRLREARGLNQTQLAERVGTTQQQIGRLERGERKLSEAWMQRLARALGEQPAYFLNPEVASPKDQANADKNVKRLGEIRWVPVISWVRAGEFSAPDYVPTEDEVESWEPTGAKVGRRAYALKVKGDSMEPDFPEGVTIIVDPDAAYKAGDFVIAANGDHEATFKQLVKDDGEWHLKPLNRQYPMKPLGDRVIVGVVVKMVKDV